MSSPASAHRAALLQIHLAVLLASAPGLFAKVLSLSPVALTCGRTLFGSIALALAAWVTRSSLRILRPRDWLVFGLSGALLAVHWSSFFFAIQLSTVGIGVLTVGTIPLFQTFLEPLVFGERLHPRDLWLALLVLCGIALITPAWNLGDHLTQGVLWGVFSAFAYAVLTLLNRSVVRVYRPLAVVFYQQGFAALCTLPLAWRAGLTLNGRGLLLLAVLGLVFTALAHVLSVSSLRHLRAQTTGLIFGLEPVYGLFLAWLLLGELPTARMLLGGCLIGAAVLGASWTHRHPLPALASHPANPG